MNDSQRRETSTTTSLQMGLAAARRASGTCPLDCPDACGLWIETGADGGFRRLRGDRDHPYTRGFLCAKTSRYHELVHHGGRLTTPMWRRGGRLEPCTWEQAVGAVAERVARTPGEQILPLGYAGNMGLVARLFPRRMMNALGAGSHDGGICSAVGAAGYRAVLGDVIGPDIEEAAAADALILWGVDAARTWQHMLPIIKERCQGGAPVMVIDVYRTDTIRRVESWGGAGLVIRPGADAALALALCRLAYEQGFADLELLERECLGASRFREHAWSAPDVGAACCATGLDASQVQRLADVLRRAKRPFIKTGTGWTRRKNGAMSMRAVCSLAAVLGHPDRVLFESSDYFGLAETVVERPELRCGHTRPAPSHQAALGRELSTGRYEVAFVWGHNPAVSLPDSARVRAGLSRDDLFLVVHEQVLTETAQLADVVLPATFFFEQSDLYCSYGHRWMHYAKVAVEAPPGPRSNLRAFAAIARALGLAPPTWDVTEESVVVELLEASRERIGDADLARLLAGERVKLSPPAREGRGTPSGRIELFSEAARQLGQPPMATWVPDCGDDPRVLWLCPAPSVGTHNSTFWSSPGHARRAGPPSCWIHPDLARERGIAPGEPVRLESAHGSLTLLARVSEDVPPHLVRVDGMPRAVDTDEGYSVNVLTGPEISDMGGGATFFSTRVDLHGPARGGRPRPAGS